MRSSTVSVPGAKSAASTASPSGLRPRDGGALVVAVFAAYAACYTVWTLSAWGAPASRALISNLAFLPLGLAAAVMLWRAAQHPALDPRTRQAWGLIGLAFLMSWTGDTVWSYYESVLGIEPFPSWADAAYLTSYPLVLAGVLRLPAGPRTPEERTTFWLDAGVAVVAGFMVLWYLLLRPLTFEHGTEPLAIALTVAYPLSDLVLVVGVATILLRGSSTASQRALQLLAFALTLQIAYDTVFSYRSLQEGWVSAEWPDAIWAWALVFAIASGQAQFSWAQRRRQSEAAEPQTPLFRLFPYLAVAVGYGLLIAVARPYWGEPLGGLIFGAVAITGLVVARQITAVRQSQRLLAERAELRAERRFRALIENASDMITVADPQGVIRYQSPSIERLLGYRADELVGRDAIELIHPDDAPAVRRAGIDAAEPGSAFTLEFRMRGRDGSWRHLEATGRNLLHNPEVQGFVLNSRDITDRKAAEAVALRSAQLERSNQDLEQFAYVASHDLQEPLRKIQAFGDRLGSRYADVLDGSGRDYLDRMQNAAGRMQTLIQDLLTFSRVTTQSQPFRMVDLDLVAREVVADLEERVERTGGRVELHRLPTVEADPLQLRQLLQNLIGNALKFHQPGVPPLVTVRARTLELGRGEAADVPLVELSVSDNGIGFDGKHAERIFAPFQRLHGRGEYEGTGMGLAICRKIVDRHGGTIVAHGMPGHGSIFTVVLPAFHDRSQPCPA